MTIEEKLKDETIKGIERAVYEWLLNMEDYDGAVKDLIEKGCSSGIASDLIYYKDICNFYDKHEEEIWDVLHQLAQEENLNIVQFLSNLNGAEIVYNMPSLKCLMVWTCFETVAYNKLYVKLFEEEK